MLRYALSIICLAILPTLAAAAPKNMTVYGRAPVGAFGVDTLEHVEGAAKLGMTLIYSYSPESAKKQLDLNDPMGKAVAKHKMQVMYPLCGRFTEVRLAREIKPTDTTIPVVGERTDSVMSFPESGYLMIEGERIEYATRTADAFGGCRRGAGGTRAAAHGVGLLLVQFRGPAQGNPGRQGRSRALGLLARGRQPPARDRLPARDVADHPAHRQGCTRPSQQPHHRDGHRRLLGDGQFRRRHLRCARRLPLSVSFRQAGRHDAEPDALHHDPGPLAAARHRPDRHLPGLRLRRRWTRRSGRTCPRRSRCARTCSASTTGAPTA